MAGFNRYVRATVLAILTVLAARHVGRRQTSLRGSEGDNCSRAPVPSEKPVYHEASTAAELHLAKLVVDQYRADRRNHNLEFVKLVVEAFVAVAAAAAGYFAYQSWVSLRESNELARASFTTSQRAYVTVNGLDIVAVRNQAGSVTFWRATPVVVNSGNTPTKNLWWTALHGDTRGIQLGPISVDGVTVGPITTAGPDSPRTQTFEDLQTVTRNRLTLGPRQEMRPLGLSTPLPADYVAGIVTGKARIYVHGAVFYEDFLTTKGHVTRYCFSLWHNEAITGSGISASPCGGATNCSDEECEDYENLRRLVGAKATGLIK